MTSQSSSQSFTGSLVFIHKNAKLPVNGCAALSPTWFCSRDGMGSPCAAAGMQHCMQPQLYSADSGPMRQRKQTAWASLAGTLEVRNDLKSDSCFSANYRAYGDTHTKKRNVKKNCKVLGFQSLQLLVCYQFMQDRAATVKPQWNFHL